MLHSALEEAHLAGLRIIADGEPAVQDFEEVLAGERAAPALHERELLGLALAAMQGEDFQVGRRSQQLRRDGRLDGPHLQRRP